MRKRVVKSPAKKVCVKKKAAFKKAVKDSAKKRAYKEQVMEK